MKYIIEVPDDMEYALLTGQTKTGYWSQAIEFSELEKAEPHWIPVTERLPDVGIDGEIEILGYEQLAIADSTFKISNPVLATRKIDDRYELAVLQWEVDGNDRKYWVNDGGDIIKGVIAWMPLPEPFKGGGD